MRYNDTREGMGDVGERHDDMTKTPRPLAFSCGDTGRTNNIKQPSRHSAAQKVINERHAEATVVASKRH